MAERGISGLAVALAATGGFLMYAGLRNIRIVDGVRELMSGKLPTPRPATPLTVKWKSAAGFELGSSAGEVAGGVGGGNGNASAGYSYELGPVRAHVRAAAYEAGPMFGIRTIGGWRVSADGDHPLGLALDFMTTSGDALANWLVANHVRLRITYVIWNRRIWNVARINEGWRPYSGTSNLHTDHVHASFKA